MTLAKERAVAKEARAVSMQTKMLTDPSAGRCVTRARVRKDTRATLTMIHKRLLKLGNRSSNKPRVEPTWVLDRQVSRRVGPSIVEREQEEYAQAMKVLGEFMKLGAVFPPEGLGVGTTPGDKAVKAITLMAYHMIELSVMDEAAAIDGSRPLEQIADSSGIAWGGTCLQMSRDLSN